MTESTVHARAIAKRMELWNDLIPHLRNLLPKHQANQQQTPVPIPDIVIG